MGCIRDRIVHSSSITYAYRLKTRLGVGRSGRARRQADVACEGGLTDDGWEDNARNGQGYGEVVSTLWVSGSIRAGTGYQMRQRFIVVGSGLIVGTKGFMGAMISNLAFVFRNIFSKKGMKGISVSGMNYYACISILSLLILTPFAIAVEGPKVWAAGWQTTVSQIGPNFVWWVGAQSVFFHLYDQVSYMSLDQISPLTFSIGNTMKRISVIVSFILIFHTPVQPINVGHISRTEAAPRKKGVVASA
ncbi:Sugar phosphate transporter domain [Sesbania bispinosa]|nr:Sugar phosphate transporter domain [Sesbania bispinosa]